MELAYDDAGTGPAVVLVHGHPFDRSLWAPQVEALAGAFRVVVPDLRGFGESPVVAGTVTMRELAADVEELLDRLGIDRAAVVGLSMGGLVVMELVLARPERWWAIGLVATTMQPVAPDERAARLERADELERDGIEPLVAFMRERLYGPSCDPAVRRTVDAMMRAASPVGAAATLRGRAERPDYRPRLAALDVPALVVSGREDPWTTAAVTDEIVRNLARPELHVYEGVSHLPNLEARARFDADLLGFLRTHAPHAPAPGA